MSTYRRRFLATPSLLALSLLTFALLLAGCDSSGDDEPALNGTWQGISEDAVNFIHIDLPTFEAYVDIGDCYAFDQAELEQVSDNTYSLEGQEETATFEVDDDELTITADDGDVTRFRRSDADVTAFTLCD